MHSGRNRTSAGTTAGAVSRIFVRFEAVAAICLGFLLTAASVRALDVTVIVPFQDESFYTNTAQVFGTTESEAAIASVWYQLNGGAWTPASTSNNWVTWSAGLTLAPYTNQLQVLAVDVAGHASAIRTTRMTCFQYARLAEATNGYGVYGPNEDGFLMECGRTFEVIARPLAGHRFASWTMARNGVVFSNCANPVLTFVMRPGLQLTANFADAPRPFDVTLSVSTTDVAENGAFTAQATVVNTTDEPIKEVFTAGEGLHLDSAGTGSAVATKLISPIVTTIPAGKSAVFTQNFEATTAGVIRLYCVIDSMAGNTATNYSPFITVHPSRLGVRTEPDRSADVTLVSGPITLQP